MFSRATYPDHIADGVSDISVGYCHFHDAHSLGLRWKVFVSVRYMYEGKQCTFQNDSEAPVYFNQCEPHQRFGSFMWHDVLKGHPTMSMMARMKADNLPSLRLNGWDAQQAGSYTVRQLEDAPTRKRARKPDKQTCAIGACGGTGSRTFMRCPNRECASECFCKSCLEAHVFSQLDASTNADGRFDVLCPTCKSDMDVVAMGVVSIDTLAAAMAKRMLKPPHPFYQQLMADMRAAVKVYAALHQRFEDYMRRSISEMSLLEREFGIQAPMPVFQPFLQFENVVAERVCRSNTAQPEPSLEDYMAERRTAGWWTTQFFRCFIARSSLSSVQDAQWERSRQRLEHSVMAETKEQAPATRDTKAEYENCPQCRIGRVRGMEPCNLCGTAFCTRCKDVVRCENPSDHVCSEDTLASLKAISKTCRQCPSCSVMIQRAFGCDHMWCTQCHTFFSYSRGTVIRPAANPEYAAYVQSQGLASSLAQCHLDATMFDIARSMHPVLLTALGGPQFIECVQFQRTDHITALERELFGLDVARQKMVKRFLQSREDPGREPEADIILSDLFRTNCESTLAKSLSRRDMAQRNIQVLTFWTSSVIGALLVFMTEITVTDGQPVELYRDKCNGFAGKLRDLSTFLDASLHRQFAGSTIARDLVKFTRDAF